MEYFNAQIKMEGLGKLISTLNIINYLHFS